ATDAEMVAGMFFGAGSLLLAAGLLALRLWMRGQLVRRSRALQGLSSLGELGRLSVLRRPGRSLAVVGMMAGGVFLVTAVNAFRMSADADPRQRDTGTGGFALIGESSLPIYENLTSKQGEEAFGLDAQLMAGVKVVPFRLREGDDASCLNLNRAQQPQLSGVDPKLLAERGAFRFAAGKETGWKALETPAGSEAAIPAIADQATAMWGLGKGVGDTLDFVDESGRTFQVKIVGLLAGSILQGKIIISEQAFLRCYPNAAGYRFFLLDAPEGKTEAVSAHLTRQLETRGLALESAERRLATFQSVQNTYIGIFTVLGGLGVLLGTVGLGVLVARHVLERRGELALMQALGFLGGALRRMILAEHAWLLIAGLALGWVAALAAVWPNLQQGSGSLPLGTLALLWGGALLLGLLVCAVAVRAALRDRLLEALRRE
ncbi:MAG: hypothetical protein KDK99_21185, partial [Verrucomicrobiales bacterium]|nr:hypothetical protein [Verrucomicrobiales bacterium]